MSAIVRVKIQMCVFFLRKVLLKTKTEWFENWIYTFGKQLVVLSTRLLCDHFSLLPNILYIDIRLCWYDL